MRIDLVSLTRPFAHVLLLPYLIRVDSESVSMVIHILRHVGDDLLGAWVGEIGSGFLNHLPKDVGVVNDHAGAEMV